MLMSSLAHGRNSLRICKSVCVQYTTNIDAIRSAKHALRSRVQCIRIKDEERLATVRLRTVHQLCGSACPSTRESYVMCGPSDCALEPVYMKSVIVCLYHVVCNVPDPQRMISVSPCP
jgi:hypothetical protein